MKNGALNTHKLCLISFSLCIIANNTFGSDAKMYIVSKMAMLVFFMISMLDILARRELTLKNYLLPMILFVMLEFFSCLWAVDSNISFAQLSTQIQLFILFMFSTSAFKELGEVKYLYISLYISGFVLLAYSLFVYGPSGYVTMITNGTRLGGLIANENGFGRVYALAGVGSFFCFLNNKKKLLHGLSTMLFLVNVLASGSRGALVVLVFGIVLSSSVYYGFKNIWKFILIGLVVLLGVYYLLNMSQFAMINHRLSGLFGEHREESVLGRQNMILVGWELFKKHPFWGTGLSSFSVISGFGTYSHNNYIEVLVSLGIIGFLIYYIPFVTLIVRILQRYGIGKDKNLLVLLMFLTIYLFYGFFTVQIYAKDFWMLLGCGMAFYSYWPEIDEEG